MGLTLLSHHPNYIFDHSALKQLQFVARRCRFSWRFGRCKVRTARASVDKDINSYQEVLDVSAFKTESQAALKLLQKVRVTMTEAIILDSSDSDTVKKQSRALMEVSASANDLHPVVKAKLQKALQ